MPRLNELKKPDWLKIKIPGGEGFRTVKQLLKDHRLHTVCEEALCPNIEECWKRKTATFMILGDICTRNCRFCGVNKGIPLPPDPNEPKELADAVCELNLSHVVITSVDRDDLPDGGAGFWAESIHQIHKTSPGCTIEVLIPDFQGNLKVLDMVLNARPDVVGHNLETVPFLYPAARSKGNYELSLQVLKYISGHGFRTKTGIMLGLGEKPDEIRRLMQDALDSGVKIFTLGQYLQPTSKHLDVKEFIPPEQFREYKVLGESLGFEHVESGPLVRSSYRADKQTPMKQQDVS
jgi:lipoic acid synthetase